MIPLPTSAKGVFSQHKTFNVTTRCFMGLGLYNTDIIIRYFVTPQKHVFPSLLAKHVCSCVNSSSAWMCRSVDVTEQKGERFAPSPITHFSHNSLWVSDFALHKSSHEVWMYEYIYIYECGQCTHTHTVCKNKRSEFADYRAAWHKKDCKYVK